jgi:hypothetical protein
MFYHSFQFIEHIVSIEVLPILFNFEIVIKFQNLTFTLLHC